MTKEKRKVQNRLAELRSAGIVLSQEQVGLLVGLDATTVSRHESGGRGMTKAQIERYAALYGVPTHEVFFVAPESSQDGGPEAEPSEAAKQ